MPTLNTNALISLFDSLIFRLQRTTQPYWEFEKALTYRDNRGCTKHNCGQKEKMRLGNCKATRINAAGKEADNNQDNAIKGKH